MSTTETFDVVVVGGGGSGLAAAIEAAEAGASVVLLEKAGELRGSTGRSIGSITATGTPDQKRKGIVDSPEEHLEDMAKFTAPYSDRDNVELARLMTGKMQETVAWLRRLGVEFFGPFEEPPHRKPRMHLVLPNSLAYIFHLSRRARALGVEIRLSCAASRLVQEEGRVVGVEATGRGGPCLLRANKGVVLAGGDFSNDPGFKREFRGDDYADIPAVNPWNTGDCQRMGRELGGVVLNGDYVLQPQMRFVPPPGDGFLARLPPYRWLGRLLRLGLQTLPAAVIRPFVLRFMTTVLAPERSLFENGAIAVDRQGRLIRKPGENVGFAIAHQAPEGAYIVFDAELRRRYSAWPHFVSTAPGVAYAYMPDYQRTRPDLYREADTLAGLAAKLGCDTAALDAAAKEHNDLAAAGAAAGRAPIPALRTPPFTALGPVKVFINLTNSGLKISPRMEVVRDDGAPIPGLFAAGSAGQGGVFLWGHGHHIGWAFTSGRIAGRNAAAMAAAA